MAGLWAQPQAPLPRMGPAEDEAQRPVATQIGGACCHSLPWRASWNPPIWKENQRPKTGPEKGIWGGGRQAEAGSGACPKLHCASLDNLEMQEGGC